MKTLIVWSHFKNNVYLFLLNTVHICMEENVCKMLYRMLQLLWPLECASPTFHFTDLSWPSLVDNVMMGICAQISPEEKRFLL